MISEEPESSMNDGQTRDRSLGVYNLFPKLGLSFLSLAFILGRMRSDLGKAKA